jgi:hypothetical protein
VFADPGFHTILPPIAVLASGEMKFRSIVFDLAFRLPSRSTDLDGLRIVKKDRSSSMTLLIEIPATLDAKVSTGILVSPALEHVVLDERGNAFCGNHSLMVAGTRTTLPKSDDSLETKGETP